MALYFCRGFDMGLLGIECRPFYSCHPMVSIVEGCFYSSFCGGALFHFWTYRYVVRRVRAASALLHTFRLPQLKAQREGTYVLLTTYVQACSRNGNTREYTALSGETPIAALLAAAAACHALTGIVQLDVIFIKFYLSFGWWESRDHKIFLKKRRLASISC